MINELFLYDRDEGLFRKILEKSTAIEGRYHVSPNYGHDLNTNNLDSFINDPKFGLTIPEQKFPICVCMTPKSRIVKVPSGEKKEEIIFHLFFVCKSNVTGKGDIKALNKDTNTSGHHVWYDWQDMKTIALNFIEVFKLQLNRMITIEGQPSPLKLWIGFDPANVVLQRHTKFNTDQLNGVSIVFAVMLDASACTLSDYEDVDMSDITMPSPEVHPLHPL